MSVNKCWANIDKSSGSLNTVLNIYFDENKTGAIRTAKIRVSSKKHGTYKDYTLVQKSKVQVIYRNAIKSKKFTKQGCDQDTEVGEELEYVVEYGRYTSLISQEDADRKALADIEKNGQGWVNENGRCITAKWYNDDQSGRFQKTDCLVTETGTFVEYKVEAGRFSSTISKDDANRKALDALESEGAEYANEHGKCVTTLWYNEEQSETFTKDDCDPGYIGEEYTYVVEAGKYTSDKSQEDANNKALEDIRQNGQDQANISVGCIPNPNYFVGKASARVQKNDCDPVLQTGSWVNLTEKDLEGYPDSFVSTESQSAANALAEAAMEAQKQGLANSKGTCIDKELYTGVYSEEFHRDNCVDGGVGSAVEVTQDDVEGGPFTSYDSQEAANALAEAAVKAQGQAIANEHGFCTWTGTYSEEFTKDDCGEGEYGSKITVTERDVIGYPFTSTESLDAANALAKSAVKAQGQGIANNRGNCEDRVVYTGHYSKMFTPSCESCHYADEMEVTAEMVNGGPVTSYDGQDVADNEAKRIVEEGGQAYADKNGICKPSSTEGQYENAIPEELRCNNGKSEIKQIDVNECSPTYNQERWVEGGTKVCSWNGVASADIQKKDCEAGEVAGTFVTVTQEDFKDIAGSGYPFTSFKSQTEANALAEAAMEKYGQQVANEKGSCNECFPITEKRFYRTNCGSCLEDVVGKLVSASEVGGPFCAPEFTAETAQSEYETRAQAYVNKNGDDCTPKNTDAVWVDSDPLETKCENGVSMKKQVNTNECYGGANEQWVPGGTLTCSWTAPDSSKTYTRTCNGAGVGGTVTVNSSELPGYPFVSYVGPDDAVTLRENAFAQHGQIVAATKPGWTCTWTGVASGTYYNNNCGTCKHGTAMTVTAEMINGGPVTSTVSQADATSKAQSILSSGGQAYANKNGDCESDSTAATWTDTGSTQCNGCTSQKQQKDTNPCSSTYNQTKWVNGGDRTCTNWVYNGTGDCVGHTQYDSYRDTCSGDVDDQYTVDCYDCCNCGSYGSWQESGCGTGSNKNKVKYVRYDDCGNQDTKYEYVDGKCGYVACSLTFDKTSHLVGPEYVAADHVGSGTSVGSSAGEVSLSSNQSWCTPRINVSDNDFTLYVECEANTSSSGRSAVVTMTNGCATKTVTINQAQKADVYEFSISSGSSVSCKDAGSCTPTIALMSTKNGSKIGYSVTSKPSWVNIVDSGGVSNIGYLLYCTATANSSTSSRSGTIILTQDESGKTIEISVTQAGKTVESCDCNLSGEVDFEDIGNGYLRVSYTLNLIATGSCQTMNNYTVSFDLNTGASHDLILRNDTMSNVGSFDMQYPSGQYSKVELYVGTTCGGTNTVIVVKS